MSRRRTAVDELMDEHIPLQGCPQLIVTRAQAWEFLTSLGYDQVPKAGTSGMRFDTVDHMVMRWDAVDLPLSDPAFRDHMFEVIRRNS